VGEVDDLVVNGELLASVGDDEDTDGAGATAESLLKAVPEVTLVDDLETVLDLAGLGHGDELTVIADINETVLLEDGSEEGVKDDGRRGVGDDARLLVELLGEEVDTEVTVLASLGGGGDADDLARTVLEDDEIADADVVAGDGEGGSLLGVDGGDGGSLSASGGGGALAATGRVTSVGVLVDVARVGVAAVAGGGVLVLVGGIVLAHLG